MKLSSRLAEAVLRDASSSAVQKARGAKVPFTNLPIEIRQDVLRAHSRHFVSYPPPGKILFHGDDATVARIRASYAYVHDCEKKTSRFPWNVAMRVLCEIKGHALGNYKVMWGKFYDRMMIPKSAAKG